MGKIVNQGELAVIFGVSDVTVWEWQKEGLPILERGERGEAHRYDTASVIAWTVDRELKKVRARSPRDEQIELQNKMLRLDLDEREKRLVPVDQVEPTWKRLAVGASAFLS